MQIRLRCPDARSTKKWEWNCDEKSKSRRRLEAICFRDRVYRFSFKTCVNYIGNGRIWCCCISDFGVDVMHIYCVAISGQYVFALHCVELIKAKRFGFEIIFSDLKIKNEFCVWLHILNLFFFFFLTLSISLQTRRLDSDNNTSTAMDHRSETDESAQQLRAMGLPKKASERAETVQHLK